MTINEIQDQIIEEFEIFDEWLDKYEYLIEMGKQLPEMKPEYKTQQNLIEGCQSRVWLHAEIKEGKLLFFADSDAFITKGIIALLIKVLNNKPPEEVASADLYFIQKIGLKENLSPTRSNGLLSMIKQMKYYAMAYIHKKQDN